MSPIPTAPTAPEILPPHGYTFKPFKYQGVDIESVHTAVFKGFTFDQLMKDGHLVKGEWTQPDVVIKTVEHLLLDGSPMPIGYEFRPENGETYQDLRKSGWTNNMMIGSGFLVKVGVPVAPALPLPPEYEWPKWAAAIIRFQESGNLCYIGVRDQIESVKALVTAREPMTLPPGSKFSIVKQLPSAILHPTADVSKFRHTVAVHCNGKLVRIVSMHGGHAWAITEDGLNIIVNITDLKPVDIERVDDRKKEEILLELNKSGLDPKSSLDSIVSKLIELGLLK